MITKEKEFETKVLIDKLAFTNLLKTYKLPLTENILIKNYYFDTPKFDIFNVNGVFRIREINNKFKATFKQAIRKSAFLEYTRYTTKKTLQQYKMGNFARTKFASLLKENGIDKTEVSYIGFLVTYRWSFKYGEGKIFIDSCIYNGFQDWEIECESKSARKAEKILVKFCLENNISFSAKSISKYARFIKTLGN